MHIEVVAYVVLILALGIGIGYAAFQYRAQQRLRSAEATAQKLVLEAQAKEKEILLEAKDEALRLRSDGSSNLWSSMSDICYAIARCAIDVFASLYIPY